MADHTAAGPGTPLCARLRPELAGSVPGLPGAPERPSEPHRAIRRAQDGSARIGSARTGPDAPRSPRIRRQDAPQTPGGGFPAPNAPRGPQTRSGASTPATPRPDKEQPMTDQPAPSRRAGLRNLLDRAARGVLVSPGEGALLRQHAEAEMQEADQLRAELAALRAVARGYCPACGRGDAAPTVADWEQQKQRAEHAEAVIARAREVATWIRRNYPALTHVNDRFAAALAEAPTPGAAEATETEKTARLFAALHQSAEQDVTRVIDLYERWVKAGPPPLGASMARWWDARLAELHDAILPPERQEQQ
jgi:hypothetical protein